MSLNESVSAEIQRLDPSSIIELFELDATDLGGDVFRFHNGTNKLNQNLVWQGNEYIRFPIQVTGFELNGQGQFPRPSVTVSNALSAITTILLQYNDLIGSKFTRKRTLLKFIDAINFPDSINPTADPDAAMPDDIYFIDRKASEDRDQVQFELASAADLQNVQLPNRTVIKNSCSWIYRGANCGYTGIPLYDANDNVIPLPPISVEGQAVMTARQAIVDAQTALDTAQTALQAATDALVVASQDSPDIRYNIDSGAGNLFYVSNHPILGWTAFWNNGAATLGTQYTAGDFVENDSRYLPYLAVPLYKIIQHNFDDAAIAAATTVYNDALTARDSAVTDLATANSDFDTALADLPLDDQMYQQDKCGKRLSSCQLRFGQAGPLPFGGFPGVAR